VEEVWEEIKMGAETILTEEERKGLIPPLAKREDLDSWEHKNVFEGRVWALGVKQIKECDPFAESYIRELHYQMFHHVWEWAGKYRISDKNLGVPFHEIHERLGVLLGNAKYWVENKTYDLDETAVRVHDEAVFIHPFPNGNGRHARLLADVIATKWGREPFSWGPDDLAAVGAAREAYIKALQLADGGDIRELLKFARS
jgi:Fic-DOC domain mobile mystery protein B